VLVTTGVALVVILFFFGRTIDKKTPPVKSLPQNTVADFDIDRFIIQSKQKLTAQQNLFLDKLENSVSRGDVRNQQITVNNQLANFWKDSVASFEPFIYYLSKAAKLENSEKNLTFAAQLILDDLRHEQDHAKLDWKTDQAVGLFEQALQLNPDNDELNIGLGSCYIYGKGRTGHPEETMKGIQRLLSVVRKDSANMKAQLVLGVGGFVSGQYDKAIDRLTKVVKAEPGNVEAIAYLADAYAGKGDKATAVQWYQVLRKTAGPGYEKEIDERIKLLQ